ncbi:MAG: rod shape-determining protein [Clostridium sp.]
MKYNDKELRFALDIGTRSIIGSAGIYEDNKFKIICERYFEHEERAMVDGQISDISLVSKGVERVVKEIREELNVDINEVCIAAAGRFLKTLNSKCEMMIGHDDEISGEEVRSLELMTVKQAEDKIIGQTDGKLYCVGYSVVNYYLNDFLISNLKGQKGEKIAVEVIATFLPRSVVDSLYTVMKNVGLRVRNITLEPIAAIEAAVPKNFRLLNIGLVDIGAGTSDIAISSKESIVAYGMVPLAGDEVTEVIAAELLIDFNSAEEVKRKLNDNDEIVYTDILGLENKIKSKKLIKLINPVVKKIAEGISQKLLELNGDKATSAVFLVGGGAYTPGLKEEIADKLGIPMQRIAIKDRSSVVDCVSENSYGSAGVTVLGIGLVAIRNEGQDFIDIFLNDEPISMFNSRSHTVQDVLLQASINPSLLLAKKGKTLHYMLNGVNRIAFGESGHNSVIRINGKLSSLESKVNEGDKVEIEYAKNGKDAKVLAKDIITTFNTISINIDGNIHNIEPIVLVNGNKVDYNEPIKEEDNVEIFMPENIEQVKKYVLCSETSLYLNNISIEDNINITEGMVLTTKESHKEEKIAYKNKGAKSSNSISVMVNGQKITLEGSESYSFVQIFNYVNFDLKLVKGTITLKLNGDTASYTDKLNDGDNIEISWSN